MCIACVHAKLVHRVGMWGRRDQLAQELEFTACPVTCNVDSSSVWCSSRMVVASHCACCKGWCAGMLQPSSAGVTWQGYLSVWWLSARAGQYSMYFVSCPAKAHTIASDVNLVIPVEQRPFLHALQGVLL